MRNVGKIGTAARMAKRRDGASTPAAAVAPAAALAAVALVALVALVAATSAFADSIFDLKGWGRDMVPVVGPTRSLAGAVVASTDPFSASILSPCAAARADRLIVTGGFVNVSTRTTNLAETKTTVGAAFPSVAVVVPFKRFSVLSGLYVEKLGSVSLASVGTLSGTGTSADSLYDFSYRREVSANSVPIFLAKDFGGRLVASGGVLVSFCDLREENLTNFRSDTYTDTKDVVDAYALGTSFAGALLADLGRLRLGALFRTGADLGGHVDRLNKSIGIWSNQDLTVRTQEAFRLGVAAQPAPWVSIEVDYDRNPWSRLELNNRALTDKMVQRWAAGLRYTGDRLWSASRYPLYLGYYRQPADWEGSTPNGTLVGEITEQVFSIGLSIPVANEAAVVTVGFETGTRASDARDDLEEKTYGVSMSISAAEKWRKEIKR
jgi:hypothetical protein